MSGEKGDTFKKARQSIQSAIEQAEEGRRRKLMQYRIDLARSGVRAYEAKKISEAVQSFHSYLRILEDFKGVPEGGLTPALFDLRKDLPELLLINGVYWDLVKLYDRTKSPDKLAQFHNYMAKFILFSKGLPFQPLAAEALRKYIYNEKPVHGPAFKNAYQMITGSKCFVATSLMDLTAPETIDRLRAFRDETLEGSLVGRRFVRAYYRSGPGLARAIDAMPESVRMRLARALDRIAAILHE